MNDPRTLIVRLNLIVKWRQVSKGVLSLQVVPLPVRDPLSAGRKTGHRAEASKP